MFFWSRLKNVGIEGINVLVLNFKTPPLDRETNDLPPLCGVNTEFENIELKSSLELFLHIIISSPL